MRGAASSYLVLVAGLLMTAAMTVIFVKAAHEKEQLRVASMAADVEGRVRSRFTRHVASLLGGAALFAVDSRVSLSEFRNFTQRLMRFGGLSGMQGLGFARRVGAAELRPYEFAMRHEVPGFRVWPEGPRSEAYPVEFLEPANWRNSRAAGYDMFTDPTRREAMERARDTGEPAATGRVTLVQEAAEGQQHGFLIYVPAYRRGRLPNTVEERRSSLVGFVYSPYRSKDLLDATLLPSDRERFAVSFYEGAAPDPARVLYEAPLAERPAMVAVKTLMVAGRPFTLQLKARPGAAGAGRWAGVIIGAALGVAVSVLLFTITRFQVAARLAAERNAERLHQARTEALRNLQTRDAFLSIASHELKTPLTALQLQVDGLHRTFTRNGVADPERLQRRLDSVRRQARRLTTLVDDLLDVSRLASGKLTLVGEEVNLATLLREIVLRFDMDSQRVGSPIHLRADAQLEGHWDPSRLDQVVTNLISNALKYGAGRPITVTAERRGSDTVIEVKDEGIGIAPADQQRIFSRFERAVPDRNFGGFGLGLWISREIITAMGGRITVSSREGEGSTFAVWLPPAAADIAAAAS